MTKSPAPEGMSDEGIILGKNVSRGNEQLVHFGKEDRVRHMYVIGQTGTGKTNLLKSMIIQDIKNGDGCCFIDPHGSDILDILANIPPERAKDVIYFDPAYTARPMGLNMLEYDRNFPEQKTLVVNELLGIFNQLFDMKSSGGPGFEQYFRNATLLVMEHPESGNTLLDISRVFSDKDYRDYKLSKSKNPLLNQFWANAEKTTGDQGLQNWVQYVNSKFDIFMTNDIMRPIVAQEKSAFDFRDIMDSKKIFLVNLSKGRLGSINANLLGLIIVGKFSQAALSRVNSNERPDFYLYIDEFQNVTTPSIASILSEARKYRLSLTLAHQYLAQLPEDIKGAVFGNVGSMAVFRVSPEDSKFLEAQYLPTFTAQDILKIENYHAYVKMLSKGTPVRPFDIDALPPEQGDRARIDQLKELSYITYGRPLDEVTEEIMRKFTF
jgi:type IV secretory pathway TraG/TraD family ATPase VirD4